MPPKKDPFSELDLRRKAQEHGIRFKGPVAPSEWPQEHKHNFDIVRAIQFLRYEDYMENKNVSKIRKPVHQKRVRDIRDKVHNLLADANPNEPSWRDLEIHILERFDGPTICGKCHNELMVPDYEASCWNPENQDRLRYKRSLRKPCVCRTKQPCSPREDEDEERDVIFCSVKEQVITHASGDDLDRYRISMKPDLAIGLRAPSYMARNEDHFPVEGRESVLLPFLVIEAKKEKGAPGFRSILCQTAFPIRRFLQAQADMNSRDLSSEPCLVWFFAYQGEIWRLHAAILDGDRVGIYELWQGNIHSRDGALQLLLLIDFVWWWARDVYRPAIRKLILTSRASFREVSPVSTDRFRHSVSLCPTSSSAPTPHYSDYSQLLGDVQRLDECTQTEHRRQNRLLDASSHESLRWSIGHENAPDWTRIGIVRHSNIAEFVFRCYSLSNSLDHSEQIAHRSDDVESSLYNVLYSHGVVVSSEQLYDIAFRWTMQPLPALGDWTRRNLRATFFFQTYCDQSTWQIKKVLTCIVWREEEDSDLEHADAQILVEAISQVSSISGRDSVWLALQTMGVVLQRRSGEQGTGWTSFAQTDLPERAFDTLRDMATEICLGAVVLRCVSHNRGIHRMNTDTTNNYQHASTFWEQDTRIGESMLAIRSTSWPERGPKFCLFVLPDIDYTSTTELHRLLEEAVSLGNFYGDIGYQLDERGWRVLQRWRRILASGTQLSREERVANTSA